MQNLQRWASTEAIMPASPQHGSAWVSAAAEAQLPSACGEGWWGERLVGSVPCSQEPPHTEGDASSTASLSVTTGIDKIDFCGLRGVGQISSLVGLLTL